MFDLLNQKLADAEMPANQCTGHGHFSPFTKVRFSPTVTGQHLSSLLSSSDLLISCFADVDMPARA